MRAKLPFKTVIVHPVVCDAAGAKMSKTRGNAVPPNALINAYGLNAVCAHMFCAELKLRRLSLSSSQMAHNRNLVTKL